MRHHPYFAGIEAYDHVSTQDWVRVFTFVSEYSHSNTAFGFSFKLLML